MALAKSGTQKKRELTKQLERQLLSEAKKSLNEITKAYKEGQINALEKSIHLKDTEKSLRKYGYEWIDVFKFRGN